TDLGGALTLQTGAGNAAGFTAIFGAVSFANTANTLATSGGNLALSSSTSVALANLATNGGDIILTADAINIPSAVNAGAGRVKLQPFSNTQHIDLGGAD